MHGDKPWFEGGVSAEAQHGNLSYNSMVSWGLAELGDALGERRFSDAALRSARHYATQVNENGWLTCAGFSDADSSFPLTHTLGYSIQGFIGVGRLCHDKRWCRRENASSMRPRRRSTGKPASCRGVFARIGGAGPTGPASPARRGLRTATCVWP